MHEVPDLAYAFDALEPHIDARTMEIHHDKHHAAYVTNLNKALDGHSDLEAKSVEDLLRRIGDVPEEIRNAVRNHGGGHANHSLFWDIPVEVTAPVDRKAHGHLDVAETSRPHGLEHERPVAIGGVNTCQLQLRTAKEAYDSLWSCPNTDRAALTAPRASR